MTENKKDMSNIEIGRRFKELIKEFDGKQEVTAAYLNYSKTTISRYCSGKEKIPDAVIEKVAKRWGVREAYIRCEDDSKTIYDTMLALSKKHNKKYHATLVYLEFLVV